MMIFRLAAGAKRVQQLIDKSHFCSKALHALYPYDAQHGQANSSADPQVCYPEQMNQGGERQGRSPYATCRSIVAMLLCPKVCENVLPIAACESLSPRIRQIGKPTRHKDHIQMAQSCQHFADGFMPESK